MCESVDLYYNVYIPGKNDTDYTKMINDSKYNNSIFLYGANPKNCGPAGGAGAESAQIGNHIRAFGILTGLTKSMGYDDNYEVDYTVSYKNLNNEPQYTKKVIDNLFKLLGDSRTITKPFGFHIGKQIKLLCAYINLYNQGKDKDAIITSVIFPGQVKDETKGTDNPDNIDWGYGLFRLHKDIIDKVAHILNTLKTEFNIGKWFNKPMKNVSEIGMAANQNAKNGNSNPFMYNPGAAPFDPNSNTHIIKAEAEAKKAEPKAEPDPKAEPEAKKEKPKSKKSKINTSTEAINRKKTALTTKKIIFIN